MEPCDLAYHVQPQPGALAAAAGRVHLIEALPYLFLLVRWDARTIVADGQHGAAARPADGHTDVSAVAAVPEGVGNEIVQQPGHQYHVHLRLHALRRVAGQDHALRRDHFLLLTYRLRQRCQVAALHAGLLGALFQPRDMQQLPDEPGHLLRLPMNDRHALDVVLCGLRCTLQRLTFCQDHRHRRPQLVAGVRGKLRLRLKGAFQPVKHIVKGPRQPVDLTPASGQADAPRQVLAAGDALRRRDDLLHRLEGAAGDEPAAAHAQHHQRRQHRPRQRHDDLHHAAPGRAVDGAPYPQAAAADLQPAVVHQIRPAAAADDGVQRVFLLRRAVRYLRRRRAEQPLSVLVEDLRVHPVGILLHVAEIPVSVVEFHIVGVPVHHVQQLCLRRPRYGVAVHQHHEHQHQCRDGDHQQGEPQGHPPFDGYVPHASSFSTQPMPRTVCSSLRSPGSSSFFRR